jgi:hypothetical protein
VATGSTTVTATTILGGTKVEMRGGTRERYKRDIVPSSSAILDADAIPRLRGGAGSAYEFRKLEAKEKLSGFVAWTAGVGRRKVTVEEWKRQKPKTRRGGVLGLIMYGRLAGLPYEDTGEAVAEGEGGEKVEDGAKGDGAAEDTAEGGQDEKSGEAAEGGEGEKAADAAEGGDANNAGTGEAEGGTA